MKKSTKVIISSLVLSMVILLSIGCSKKVRYKYQEYNIKDVFKENSSSYSDSIKLLKSLKDYAKGGRINKYNFKIGDIIESVYNLWGEEDERAYVEKDKGVYSTYYKEEVVFGFNKGSQIFEIRSYDKKLRNINLSEIKEVYKDPEYNVINDKNQRVVGYTVNEDYKIEFVLNNPKYDDNQQFVEYYNVLCPKFTINSMADDPGRQW